MIDKAALGELIAERIRNGVGFERAAALEGVHKRTAYRWKRAGDMDLATGKATTNAEFAQAVGKANATRIARAETYLHNAQDLDDESLAPKDKAHNARWLLTRLASQDYGDDITIRLQGELETLIGAVRPLVSAGAYEELINAIASLAGVDFGGAEESLDDPADVEVSD